MLECETKLHHSETPLRGVELVVRAIINRNDKILLVKRSELSKNRAGLWEFPGGKLDADRDQGLLTALKRETAEETGFVIEFVQQLKLTKECSVVSNGTLYLANYAFCRIVSGRLMLNDESSDATWSNVSDALENLSCTADTQAALNHLNGINARNPK